MSKRQDKLHILGKVSPIVIKKLQNRKMPQKVMPSGFLSDILLVGIKLVIHSTFS